MYSTRVFILGKNQNTLSSVKSVLETRVFCYRTINQRPGGESTKLFATFLCTSLCSVINIQILHCTGGCCDFCQERTPLSYQKHLRAHPSFPFTKVAHNTGTHTKKKSTECRSWQKNIQILNCPESFRKVSLSSHDGTRALRPWPGGSGAHNRHSHR